MTRLTRSTIIPANSEYTGTVEKWSIPDMRSARASVVSLDDARKRSSGSARHLPQQSLNQQAGDAAGALSKAHESTEAAFEAGYSDGLRTAKEQYAEKQQQLEYLLQVLENPVSGLGDEVASELVSLSVEIARAVLNREIQQQPEQIIEFVTSAMAQLPHSEQPVRITVHPEDLALIKAHAMKSLQQHNINWIEDTTVARGSFNIAQDESVIHGGVEAMLDTVLKQLNIHVDQQ